MAAVKPDWYNCTVKCLTASTDTGQEVPKPCSVEKSKNTCTFLLHSARLAGARGENCMAPSISACQGSGGPWQPGLATPRANDWNL